MSLTPITTKYKGYRFRSRLEARWAVFFDALGMKWEYEKEGYDLEDLGWYLPDFWLGKKGRYGWDDPEAYFAWAEVKSEAFSNDEIERCKKLVSLTKKTCILLVGLPDTVAYDAIEYDEETGKAQDYFVEVLLHSSKNRFWWMPSEEDIEYLRDEDMEYRSACDAARSARFEHGESG